MFVVSRLVEVLIRVVILVKMEMKFSGIISCEVDVFMCVVMVDMIGRNMIMIGVLLVKVLVVNIVRKVRISVMIGCLL